MTRDYPMYFFCPQCQHNLFPIGGGRCEKCGTLYTAAWLDVDPHAKPPDPVNHPAHCMAHPSGVECITIARHFSFNLGNVLKYIWRAAWKGATLQDLKKARWYLDDEIKQMEELEKNPK